MYANNLCMTFQSLSSPVECLFQPVSLGLALLSGRLHIRNALNVVKNVGFARAKMKEEKEQRVAMTIAR